jgi:hypothetical protein
MPTELAKAIARQALYTLSPSAWCRRELKLVLDPWQADLIDTPAGRRAISLTHRQAGKTTAAAIGAAHTMLWRKPASTNPVLAPTLRQSSELIRNLRGWLIAVGEKLARRQHVLRRTRERVALPGDAGDASIRGLSIDGDLVVDEAARVSDALFEAAQPMLIRHAHEARLILLSTAWARQGFFYRVWAEGSDEDWIKIEAKVDACLHISRADLDRERRSMSPAAFRREYENTFHAIESRFFDLDAIAAAFGAVEGPAPPPPGADPDPVVSRAPAFGLHPSFASSPP